MLERYGWNEDAKLEDYELYLRLSAEGEFTFDPRVLSAWRQHHYNASLNVTMMMNERLDAQRRLAEIGLSAGQLERFQRLARFRIAQDFMRRGKKLKAAKLMLES